MDARVDIECAIRSSVNVLISGGDSTTRTALARLIHDRSTPPGGPLVVLNVGSLVAPRRAEPDARTLAAGHAAPTIFIEELAALDGQAQDALLRLTDRSGRFGESPGRGETRIIAGTGHDVRQGLSSRQFNPDLFYRLNVIHIALGHGRRFMRDDEGGSATATTIH